MAAALQPAVPIIPILRRTERVLRVSPVEITLALGDDVIAVIHELAENRVIQELEQRLRTAYQNNPAAAAQMDPEAGNENDFVLRNVQNPGLRAAAQIPSYESYTFLAPHSSVQFQSAEFHIADLPKDVNLVTIHADGPNGRFIDLKIRSVFQDFNEIRNPQLNQIIVQGETLDWVNATYERIRAAIDPQRLRTRGFVYGNSLTLFWISVVLLLFAEYRAAKFIYPAFNLATPLSGTGALVMFAVLAATVIIFGNVVIRAFSYVFPYFEIQDNLSRPRVAMRKAVIAVVGSLYVGAAVNAISLIFGPLLKRLITP